MAVLSSQAGFSSSFAPSSSSSSTTTPRHHRRGSIHSSTTQVFYQSALAMPPEQQQQQQQEHLFSRRSVYRDSFPHPPQRITTKACRPVTIQVREVVKKKTKANKRTVRDCEHTIIQDTKEEDDEEHRQKLVLRAHSLLELKLMCSRRNIRYGTFAAPKQKDEYVQAIWDEMRHEGAANVVSVTGLLHHPGTVVELTQAQLEQELGSPSSTVILVDVYAPWCTPCREFLPQLELATKVLSLKQNTASSSTPVRVVKLNYDELQPSWIERYAIAGLPGLLLFQPQSQERGGAVLLDRMDGSHTTPEIVAFVQHHTTTTTSAVAR